MTDFKMIPLSEIHPDKNQPRKFFDDHAIKELTESIRDKGVLQPIMVRPNGKGYILVCGERRYRASVSVKAAEIPAVVRSLTDEEALEIQFIENIQRADVHPMDEASTFKQMLENKLHPYSIADIAAKINKPESYVVHRLALNNLIPELQKEFWAGKFLIGQAVLLARLSSEHQKEVSKEARSWSTKELLSTGELRSHIERNILRKLGSAPFNIKDETLNPEMGACTNCSFRSGSNPSLFNDIKESDRCFNKSCFEIKSKKALVFKVKDIIENKPEIHLLCGKYYRKELDPELQKLISDNGLKLLESYDDYTTYADKRAIKAKGLHIGGYDAGKIETIYLKNKNIKSEDGKPVTSIDFDIAGIKQRTNRAAELDDEKVWKKIHEEIINVSGKHGLEANPDLIVETDLSALDTAALVLAMYEKAGPRSGDILDIFYKKKDTYYLDSKEKRQFTDKVMKATPEQVRKAFRLFISGVLDSSVSSHTANAGQGILKQVAEQYKKSEIEAIEAEQKEKRDKREARAAVRIKALQTKKKEEKKPAPKKAAKKAAPKKAAKAKAKAKK